MDREQLVLKVNKAIEDIMEEHKNKIGVEVRLFDQDFADWVADNNPSIEAIMPRIHLGIQELKESYARRILAVCQGNVPEARTASVTETCMMTLNALADKTLDLSKLNSNLNIGKLSPREVDVAFAFDRTIDPFNINVELCDRHASDEQKKLFEKLMVIDHIAKSKKDDTGHNGLYVVVGALESWAPGCKFPFQAPILRVPVELCRSGNKMLLRNDGRREILLNETLALAFMSKSGFKPAFDRIRPTNKLSEIIANDDSEEKGVYELIKAYYAQFGMNLSIKSTVPVKYEPLASKEFEEICGSDMEVKPYVILGTFEAPNAAMHDDLMRIIEDRDPSQIMYDLIMDSAKVCDTTDDVPGNKSLSDIRECQIGYMNRLNSSQENILRALSQYDTIAVRGPPGTGKSQVIAGLITDSVLRKKNVMVVCQKKSALDVIASRLGNIAKYALVLTDSSDVETFCQQIKSVLSHVSDPGLSDNEACCKEVDEEVEKLGRIHRALYVKDEGLKVPMYVLYLEGRHFNTKTAEGVKEFERVSLMIRSSVQYMSFEELKKVHGDMAEESISEVMYSYFSVKSVYPWVAGIKQGLSDSDVVGMVEEISANREALNGRKGLFGKRQLIALSGKREFVRKYLNDPDTYEYLLESNEVQDLPVIYQRYYATKSAFDNEPESLRDYAGIVYDVSGGDKHCMTDSNDLVYYAVIAKHIEAFERDHPELKASIRGFKSSIDKIERRIEQKMKATRVNVEHELVSCLRNLDHDKRELEMIMERENKFPISKVLRRFPILDAYGVILATPECVSEVLPHVKGLRDLLIIDEGSQMFLENALPAMYRAKKVVICGDDKQLRPSSLGSSRLEYEEDTDEVDDIISRTMEQPSVFHLASRRYPLFNLDTHYRSVYEELIAFSNAKFYGGRLLVSPNICKPEKPPISFRIVKGGVWSNKCNKAEAVAAVDLVEEILSTRQHNESIGVCTFNEPQKDAIEDELLRRESDNPRFAALMEKERHRVGAEHDESIFIKNIESIQGDERDIIIFSVGYAKDPEGRFMQRFGWLNQSGGENRLNVAITRARRGIHVITSQNPSEFKVDNTKNRGPKLLKEYLEYAMAVNNGDDVAVKRILGSDVPVIEKPRSLRAVDELGRFLISKGFRVEKNVGISGNNIDLVVSDRAGRVIIGIEADPSVYIDNASVRERDLHRIRYFKSRGWNIERFWISEYYDDPSVEMGRILDIVQKRAVRP